MKFKMIGASGCGVFDAVRLGSPNTRDVFWVKEASITDLDSLPEPDVLAEEILENLRSALSSFELVAGDH